MNEINHPDALPIDATQTNLARAAERGPSSDSRQLTFADLDVRHWLPFDASNRTESVQ